MTNRDRTGTHLFSRARLIKATVPHSLEYMLGGSRTIAMYHKQLTQVRIEVSMSAPQPAVEQGDIRIKLKFYAWFTRGEGTVTSTTNFGEKGSSTNGGTLIAEKKEFP